MVPPIHPLHPPVRAATAARRAALIAALALVCGLLLFAAVARADDGMHATVEASAATTVSLDVTPDARSGYNVHIVTTGFTWAPEQASGAHVAGMGHAHLYVNGEKVARVYGPWLHLATLPEGEVEIHVTLNGNDHSTYTYRGEVVGNAVTMTIGAMAATGGSDAGMSAADPGGMMHDHDAMAEGMDHDHDAMAEEMGHEDHDHDAMAAGMDHEDHDHDAMVEEMDHDHDAMVAGMDHDHDAMAEEMGHEDHDHDAMAAGMDHEDHDHDAMVEEMDHDHDAMAEEMDHEDHDHDAMAAGMDHDSMDVATANLVPVGEQSLRLEPMLAVDGRFRIALTALHGGDAMAAPLQGVLLTPGGERIAFQGEDAVTVIDAALFEPGRYTLQGTLAGEPFSTALAGARGETDRGTEAVVVLAPAPSLAGGAASEVFAYAFRDGDNVHERFAVTRSMAGMQHMTDAEEIVLTHSHFDHARTSDFEPAANQGSVSFAMAGEWQLRLLLGSGIVESATFDVDVE